MVLGAPPSSGPASHSFTLSLPAMAGRSRRALNTSHLSFLIYGTGIRITLNPFPCTANSVLIYGNHAAECYVPAVSLVPGHPPELSFARNRTLRGQNGTVDA